MSTGGRGASCCRCRRRTRRGSRAASSMSPRWRPGWARRRSGSTAALPAARRILVFRRVGRKIVAEIENPPLPRHRRARRPSRRGVRDSFAYSTIWMGDIAAETRRRPAARRRRRLPHPRRAWASPRRCKDGGGGEFRLVAGAQRRRPRFGPRLPREYRARGAADLRLDRARPPRSSNIAPVTGNLSFVVRHSLIRLPEPGYRPRRFDPRAGTFGSQVVDFAAAARPADRLRARQPLPAREDSIPSAPRSRVRQPIIFYVDRAAPEPIRTALIEGAGWWRQAFEAAGYHRRLPGRDAARGRRSARRPLQRRPLGQPRDPRLVLRPGDRGSAHRRDHQRPGAARLAARAPGHADLRRPGRRRRGPATGGPNDPVAGRARPHPPARRARGRPRARPRPQFRRQHPGPLFGDGLSGAARRRWSTARPTSRDAYGVGVGRWDRFAVDWLYGADSDAEARAAHGRPALAEGLRYVGDGEARAAGAAQPLGSLWDDGAEPVAELRPDDGGARASAVARFGPRALYPGEPVANLRRKFVPIWLLHRYQVEAAAKLIGGVDFAYALQRRRPRAAPVVPRSTDQRRALDALLGDAGAGRARPCRRRCCPISRRAGRAARTGRRRSRSSAPPAARSSIRSSPPRSRRSVTLDSLLAPERLNRLEIQHQADGAHARRPPTLFERLIGRATRVDVGRTRQLQRRIAHRDRPRAGPGPARSGAVADRRAGAVGPARSGSPPSSRAPAAAARNRLERAASAGCSATARRSPPRWPSRAGRRKSRRACRSAARRTIGEPSLRADRLLRYAALPARGAAARDPRHVEWHTDEVDRSVLGAARCLVAGRGSVAAQAGMDGRSHVEADHDRGSTLPDSTSSWLVERISRAAVAARSTEASRVAVGVLEAAAMRSCDQLTAARRERRRR